ncbi:MAG: TIGR02444 family protein [Robiginitomaculum sp.]|nr:TIGR02444 family protein [Robiginitomaculum sp.]
MTHNINSLWEWSLDVYSVEATRNACLTLQDQHSLDINTLLWLCWCANNHKTPTAWALDKSKTIGLYWQSELIAGIRNARKHLGNHDAAPSCQNLKKELLKLELLAEHRQQNQLEALTTFSQDQKKWTKANLCQNNLDLLLASLRKKSLGCARATEKLCASLFEEHPKY